MAEGLKRASQAAARTRWDGTLSPDMRVFLNVIAKIAGLAQPRDLPPATHKQSRARQKCRHLGLAEFVDWGPGKVCSGWQITEAGRLAIKDA